MIGGNGFPTHKYYRIPPLNNIGLGMKFKKILSFNCFMLFLYLFNVLWRPIVGFITAVTWVILCWVILCLKAEVDVFFHSGVVFM